MSITTAVRPRLLEPGLRLLPPGVERYVVRGNGVTVFELFAGDRLEIVDPEGRQAAEVVSVSLTSAKPVTLSGDFKRVDSGVLHPGPELPQVSEILSLRSIAAALRV